MDSPITIAEILEMEFSNELHFELHHMPNKKAPRLGGFFCKILQRTMAQQMQKTKHLTGLIGNSSLLHYTHLDLDFGQYERTWNTFVLNWD